MPTLQPLPLRAVAKGDGEWASAVVAIPVADASHNAVPGAAPGQATRKPRPGRVEADAVAVQIPEAAADDDTPRRRQVLATADGVELVASPAVTRLVGYHQAGTRRALALHPRGTPRTNRNAGRYRAPPPSPGPDYAVLWNRFRGTHPTSAVDLAVAPDQPVPSPVSGVVDRVRPYTLYGRQPDAMVVVTPHGRPDREVVMLHLAEVTVRPGDEVVAGRTPLARRARPLGFPSQIDDFVGTGVHIHVEVRVR